VGCQIFFSVFSSFEDPEPQDPHFLGLPDQESGSISQRSGSGAGSISQRYKSADPDPLKNVTDPQHWFLVYIKNRNQIDEQKLSRVVNYGYTTLPSRTDRKELQ
jgi:hypothetical protein